MNAETSASEKSAPKLLELDAVTQVFSTRRGDVRAVDDVSFSVDAGEVLCLVGQSGSGKSTAAKIGSGLLSPTSGTVRFEGTSIYPKKAVGKEKWRDFRKSVQYVHQDPYSSLNPIQDVYTTLSAPLLRHGFVRNQKEIGRAHV